MQIKIRHGILELNSKLSKEVKSSSIVINDEFVLTSASILSTCFQNTTDSNLHNIFTKLINDEIVHFDKKQDILNAPFRITYDEKRLKTEKRLTSFPAELLYWFKNPDIQHSVDTIFPEAIEQNVFLSSFLLLRVKKIEGQKYSLNSFLKKVLIYLKFIPSYQKLDDALIICTPFGETNFYKSITISKFSNVLGVNNCLFLLSNSLPVGCEGAAVFNSKLRLVGLIIFTSFCRQGENVNLTCGASSINILRNFAHKMSVWNVPQQISKIHSSHYQHYEKCLVSIENNGISGTGTIIQICDKCYVLTCSHVISHQCKYVTCQYGEGSFRSEVIWSHNQANEPFDVALLTVPESIGGKNATHPSKIRPHIGQHIYAAGFAVLPQGSNVISPSINEGRVIKYSPDSGILISDCCVQYGQSGGPLLDEFGHVLGILIANVTFQDVVYPHVNISIPLEIIQNVLEKFAKTNDISTLTKLIADSTHVKHAWSLQESKIISKL